jgi:hypothetical protein
MRPTQLWLHYIDVVKIRERSIRKFSAPATTPAWNAIGGQCFRNSLSRGGRRISVEALKSHRCKGEQRVLVEHVHLHAGGQAIVDPSLQSSRAFSRYDSAANALLDLAVEEIQFACEACCYMNFDEGFARATLAGEEASHRRGLIF